MRSEDVTTLRIELEEHEVSGVHNDLAQLENMDDELSPATIKIIRALYDFVENYALGEDD